MKNKILLTGGSGFIGKNFLELKSNKYNIVTPNHQELDLLDTEKIKTFLEKEKFETIIHAANLGGGRNQSQLTNTYEVNTKIFLNLANNAQNFGKMIFIGSGAEYGKHLPIIMTKEEDFGKIQPQDDYGRAKYFVSEYIQDHGRIINLRCFGIYGKYEDYRTRFISKSICRALYNLPIVINKDTKFDYTYAPDFIEIIDYFASNSPREKFYNVGSGNASYLSEIAGEIKEAVGSNIEVIFKGSEEGNEYTCDNSRLRAEIKSFKFTPQKQAIRELVDYYRNIISEINPRDLEFD